MASPDHPQPKRLAEAPSARYAPAPGAPAKAGSSLRRPAVRAALVAIAGAAATVIVGEILASIFGLLLIAGATGTTIGLVVARAAVPDDGRVPTPRRTAVRVALGLALLSLVLGDLGLWLFAQSEGGVLSPFDYLWQTFGPLVPGTALVALATAWWGATAGPVQR